MTRQIKKVIQNKLEWQLKRNEEFKTCILTVSLEFIDAKKTLCGRNNLTSGTNNHICNGDYFTHRLMF